MPSACPTSFFGCVRVDPAVKTEIFPLRDPPRPPARPPQARLCTSDGRHQTGLPVRTPAPDVPSSDSDFNSAPQRPKSEHKHKPPPPVSPNNRRGSGGVLLFGHPRALVPAVLTRATAWPSAAPHPLQQTGSCGFAGRLLAWSTPPPPKEGGREVRWGFRAGPADHSKHRLRTAYACFRSL